MKINPSLLLVVALLSHFSVTTSWAGSIRVSNKKFILSEKNFVPRGGNYTRLGSNNYHITFANYDRSRAENILTLAAQFGYNSIRVFLEPEASAATPTSKYPARLKSSYMRNLTDFISFAQSKNIYVIIAKDMWLPWPYLAAYAAGGNDAESQLYKPTSVNDINVNQYVLHRKFVYAAEKYWFDIAAHIKRAGLSRNVLGYDIFQEAFYRADQYPFSLRSGTFKAWDNLTYEMSTSLISSRQQLADAMAVAFANTLRASIVRADSTALVTMSLYSPRDIGQIGHQGLIAGPAGTDQRRPMRLKSLDLYSSLDYLGLHLYSHDGTTNYLESAINSQEILKSNLTRKALLIDEIGLIKEKYQSNLDRAAAAARVQLDFLCDYKVAGWLFWTFDTFEQPEFFPVASDQGQINNVIAPALNPVTKCGL